MAVSGNGKTAVVVGAGPAGMTAALVLARQGFSVQVYDKMPELDKATVNLRSYFLYIDWRTLTALQKSGCNLEELRQHMGACRGFHIYSAGKPKPLEIIYPKVNSAFLLERYQLLNHIQAEAESSFGAGRKGPQIEFHWGRTVKSVDVAGKLAVFESAAGTKAAVHYDLLIGADGVHSPVREALASQVPGFKCHVDHSWEGYIALTIDQHTDLFPAAGKKILMFAVLDDWANPCPKDQPSGELSFVQSPAGPWTVHMALHREGMQRYRSKADFLKVLAPVAALPQQLREHIAEAFAAGSQFFPGANRVKCSQLHGPGVILLGDAGHATTEKTGQGCNSAMEDTLVLDQVLQEADDLEGAPAAYTRARLADVHALYIVNRDILKARGRHGIWQLEFLITMNQFVVWGGLRKALPWLIPAPKPLPALGPQWPSYTESRADAWAKFVVTVGCLAALGAAAAAGVVAALRR